MSMIEPTEERKDYSADQRKKMAANGQAMPDGSYPIANKQDLANAIQAYGRAKNQAAVKRHIIKRARALGALKMLPESWGVNDGDGDEDDKRTLEAVDQWRSELAERGLAGWSVLPPVELRGQDGGTGDGSWTIHGYAAVFNAPTILHEGKNVRVSEEILPGAFSDVLTRQDKPVHLNIGHNMGQVMASTDVRGIGGLELRQDDQGLRYFARVNPEVSYIRDAAVLMRDGVIRGASFKFRIGDEERVASDLEDGRKSVHYRISKVYPMHDVCVTPIPAYQQATSNIRSLAEYEDAMTRRNDDDSLGDPRRTPSVGVTLPASTGEGGGDQVARVAAMRAHVRLAATQLRKV